mgnify:CR=1 FL=1
MATQKKAIANAKPMSMGQIPSGVGHRSKTAAIPAPKYQTLRRQCPKYSTANPIVATTIDARNSLLKPV